MLRLRRQLRRHSASDPHMDLIPLVDVVFQMLFFFMIAMTVMSQVKTRSVAMSSVVDGQSKGALGAGGAKVYFLVVNGEGQTTLDGQVLNQEALEKRLKNIAAEDGASLHVGLEAAGDKDRGPAVFDLIQRVSASGIPQVAFTQLEGLGSADQPKAKP